MPHSIDWKPILLACLTISIGQLSMGLVFPALPWIAQDFGIDLDQAQLLIAVYLLGFGPSQFIYGPISDALGRRKVLLSGLVLALVGLTVVVIGSNSFPMIVLGRFIQGLGTGCCAVLARALIRDSYSGKQLPTALAYIAMVASFTPIVAPVIGGFINHHFGWISIFVLLLSYLVTVWLILFVRFEETMRNRTVLPSIPAVLTSYVSLLKSRYFISFASIGWLNFSLVITTTSVMPFIMQMQIGMSSDRYALWALIPALGFLCGTFFCNKMRPKFGLKAMLYTAPCMQVLAAIWLIIAPLEPWAMMLGQFLLVFGNGIALPCAQAQVMLPFKNRAGVAAALSGGGQMIVSALVSMFLVNIGINQAWELGCLIGVFALITSLNVYRGFQSTPPSG
ncbi:Bcr/CflA family efflux MFS transporter [Alginatibacterium sediminis]|uniref:Bcr/CflA family efflux transporter n=1 Tax=Alginatibacterium sediminis TaxID=2164068 RepID=A0A420E6E4_9ALTE|nr:multidrug effflux MFS transporter [Alginatibacterium sediminis]RKF13726.1 Bcr/CflA family efflux MFS transporter [Alginatibacterium sediminis]